MATTIFFEGYLEDRGSDRPSIYLEVGRCSYYPKETLIMITADDKTVIVSEKVGRALCEAFADVATYLGYDR